LRDKAILLLGFAGAFRRSEIVGLQVRDIQISDAGLIITLRRSKTDQEGVVAFQMIGIGWSALTLRRWHGPHSGDHAAGGKSSGASGRPWR
jgi:integrase